MTVALYIGDVARTEKVLVEGAHLMPFDEVHGIAEEQLSRFLMVDSCLEQPTPKVGKTYFHYVNCITLEQWYEEVERELTPEEKTKLELEDLQTKNSDLNLQLIDLWEILINGGVI